MGPMNKEYSWIKGREKERERDRESEIERREREWEGDREGGRESSLRVTFQ